MATGAQYRYNALGRLTGVIFDDGASVSYLYDNLGNRTCVMEVASCCNSEAGFTIYTKNVDFTADDGPGSYYRITADAVVTMPSSPADASVRKFKVVAGTASFNFFSTQKFNHANGVSDQHLVLTARSGVVEIIAVENGWDET